MDNKGKIKQVFLKLIYRGYSSFYIFDISGL